AETLAEKVLWTSFSKACAKAPDSGPCFGMVQRYFYNPTKMSCEIFNYGGCLGNQNNFVTEKECLQRCPVCRLPMDAKPCVGSPPIWTFNSTSGLCVPFKQGYCQANGNKFYTKSECDEYCGVIKAGEAMFDKHTFMLQGLCVLQQLHCTPHPALRNRNEFLKIKYKSLKSADEIRKMVLTKNILKEKLRHYNIFSYT
uniref:BPTI/Kunitz inhibitor domain-containing protein n=1 Tax=Oryzias sinensis TaxID=183150 RepID=A0A8C7ZIM1_9TELE